jgi:hypothetical protein
VVVASNLMLSSVNPQSQVLLTVECTPLAS